MSAWVEGAPSPPPVAARLTLTVAAGSLALVAAIGALAYLSGSQLALAQAADSLADCILALALLWAIHVAAAPADENHPHGHHGAEPIAALVTAVLAGVLAMEVVSSAVGALARGDHPILSWSLAIAFGVKLAFKVAVSLAARMLQRTRRSPALHALEVDARNDCFVSLLGLVGFFAARFDSEGWDAYLALPVGVYIGYSGISLARENIRLLMGEATDDAHRLRYEKLAGSVPGVRRVASLTAHHHGAHVVVMVAIVVDSDLTVRAAHDVGLGVERRLLAEAEVVQCIVHVDVAATAPGGGDVAAGV